jgi:hypothetical protein
MNRVVDTILKLQLVAALAALSIALYCWFQADFKDTPIFTPLAIASVLLASAAFTAGRMDKPS